MYQRPNGTAVYLDLRYPVNTWCNASIAADSDIAGPGTLLSFVVPAVFTIMIALVRAACSVIIDHPNLWTVESGPGATDGASRFNIRKQCTTAISFCNNALTTLCNVQIFIGPAIIIAAFLKGSDLSFYHEEIVARYWWLIMNSFWAAMRKYAGKDDTLAANIQKSLVILAVIPAVVFNARELIRQPRGWDFLDGTQCYLYDTKYGSDHDAHNIRHWFSLLGMVLYTFYLSASMFPSASDWISSKEKALYQWQSKHLAEATTHYESLVNRFNKSPSHPNAKVSSSDVFESCKSMVSHGSLAASTFIATQLAAFWSYADGYEPIQVVLHTQAVLSGAVTLYKLKALNKNLVRGDEYSWGFEQSLPIVMLGSMLFSLFTVLHDKHLKTA